MIIGKVVGSVVSTRKCDNLVGNKFMIVEPIPSLKVEERIVAVDKVGAGIGEFVLVAREILEEARMSGIKLEFDVNRRRTVVINY